MKLRILTPKLVGEVLATSIYTSNGGLLLKGGVVLNTRFLNHLTSLGITTVYIEDENTDITLQEKLDALIRVQVLKDIRDEFMQIAKSKQVDDTEVKRIVNTLIMNINLSENAFAPNNITSSEGDTAFVTHALDVALLSIAVGVGKGYSSEKVQHLAIGALLHDIGKLFTKDSNEHSEVGYDIARTNTWLPSTSTIVIKQHHDVTPPNTHEYSKIVNVCNAYMNLQASNLLPYQIIEQLAINTPFDTYQDFVKTVYTYPNGMEVILNNGQNGVVVSQNKGFPSRPVVVARSAYGLDKLNLTKDLTLFIDQIVI